MTKYGIKITNRENGKSTVEPYSRASPAEATLERCLPLAEKANAGMEYIGKVIV
mgnify:CR=1 FL=1